MHKERLKNFGGLSMADLTNIFIIILALAAAAYVARFIWWLLVD